MKRVLLVSVIGVGLLLAASASAKPGSRIQKFAPVAADMKAAASATLKLSDLTSGWHGGSAKPDNPLPDCKKNFSAFTITGDAEADFTQGGAAITSTIQVFRTKRQAIGDFKVDTPLGIVACEGAALRTASGPGTKLLFARQVAPPKVGGRAVAYDFAEQVNGVTFYIDVINFVRDRAYGSLITLDPQSALPGSTLLAELMDKRLVAALR